MATEPRPGRVILHLHHGATERVIIRAAAEFARMLGATLQGVFLEDEALPELAALPFIREFRLGTGAWHKLDRQQIAAEQHAAATEARRLLDEAAAALGVTRLFEIISGDPALFVAATSQAGDVIVVAQPRLPAERLVHATARWLEAAHGCAASVLLVPPVLAQRAGPVAAVVCAEFGSRARRRGAHCCRGGRGTAVADLGDGGVGQGCGRAGAFRRSVTTANLHRQHTWRSAGACPGRSRLRPRASGRAGTWCMRDGRRGGIVAYRGLARRSRAGGGTLTMGNRSLSLRVPHRPAGDPLPPLRTAGAPVSLTGSN